MNVFSASDSARRIEFISPRHNTIVLKDREKSRRTLADPLTQLVKPEGGQSEIIGRFNRSSCEKLPNHLDVVAESGGGGGHLPLWLVPWCNSQHLLFSEISCLICLIYLILFLHQIPQTELKMF